LIDTRGADFIHHSNYGSYRRSANALAPLQTTLDRLPTVARAGLLRMGLYRGAHWRASSVSAPGFAELTADETATELIARADSQLIHSRSDTDLSGPMAFSLSRRRPRRDRRSAARRG